MPSTPACLTAGFIGSPPADRYFLAVGGTLFYPWRLQHRAAPPTIFYGDQLKGE